MKQAIGKLKSIIRNLGQVIEKEKTAIAQRAYGAIAELSASKEALLEDFDAISASLHDQEATDALTAELNILRISAEENASSLKALAQGVEQARLRLKALQELELRAGAYQRDGATIKNPSATTISAKV